MTRKKYPSGQAGDMDTANNCSENNTTTSNIYNLTETAICPLCHGHFIRRINERWKWLCLTCWIWDQLGKHIEKAAKLFRGVK